MKPRTKRIIFVLAISQLLLAAACLALPPAVRALPGIVFVRLQSNPLTSGVVELITTPIPESLPAAIEHGEAFPASGERAAPLEIPGLDEATATARPTTTPLVEPTPVAQTESGVAVVTPQAPAPTVTPPAAATLPPPAAHTIENVGTVIQGFNNCGPANLTIVLNYFGDETTQEIAASYLKPNREDRNVSPWQINNYVNEFTTLRSTAHSGGNMNMLKQFIAADIPVVVEKGYLPNEEEGWYGHYLTVYGYDDTKQEIYSRDTNDGPFDGSPRIDSYEEFNYWWQQFNYTFYVVYEPSQESLVFRIIPTQLQNEAGMWQYTVELAQQEIAADPANVFAIFNLGVGLTRLGQLTGETVYYEEGAAAFDQARAIGIPPRTLYYEHRPFMAYWKTGQIDEVLALVDAMLATPGGRYVEEIFWYQGHALAAQGDLVAAGTAYRNALEVNPNFFQAQQSLDWLEATLTGG